MQEVRLLALTDFQFVEDNEQSNSNEASRLSYIEKGVRLANQPILPRSFSMTRLLRFQPRIIMATTNNKSYKVKLEYFNR